MKIAVIGATGYTGMLLLRLLEKHPKVSSILPVSGSKTGNWVWEEDPGLGMRLESLGLYEDCQGRFLSVDEAAAQKPDVVFAALPHLESARICEPFFGISVVIDLSADFRSKSPTLFEEAYGQKPPRPDLLEKAVYGLAEWNTEAIKTADLIANPGCYPTCSLLPLLPLYQAGLIQGRPIINALSGISGAGKKATLNMLMTERGENAGTYNPGRKHRHSKEIEEQMGEVSGGTKILFQPHLVPMKRGMASTIVVPMASGRKAEEVPGIWSEAYKGRPFVQWSSRIPQTLDVWGSNRCDMSWQDEGDTLLLFSVIDNLMKGASGQAVQNMNLRFGFPENEGLPLTNQF